MDPLGAERPPFHVAYPEIARQVRKCVRRLRAAHGRELADVEQEALVAVAEGWAGYDPELPLTPWIEAIVLRIARPRLGRAGQEATAAEEDPAGAGEAHQRLLGLLRPMDEDRRIVFTLKVLDDFSMSEVAEMLQIPVPVAYTRLRAAWREVEDRARAQGVRDGAVALGLGMREAIRRRLTFS